MKKPFNVLATALLAGTMFTTSISPVFAETDLPTESNQFEGQKPATDIDQLDPLPPLETGEGFTNFKDANGTIYAHAVWFVTINGIAQGLTDKYFGVEEPIKRVDAAVILGDFMYIDQFDVPKAAFTDVPPRAAKIISALKHYGIINGKSETKFAPDLQITRGEAAIMLYNAHKDIFPPIEELDNRLMFTDVSDRYKEAVHVLSEAGIIKGKSNNKFGTSESLTRGQLALLIERIYYYEGPLGAEDNMEYPSEASELSITTDKKIYNLDEDENIKVLIENHSDQTYTHRPELMLQKRVDGKWYKVPYSGLINFPTILDTLEGYEMLEQNFDLHKGLKAPLIRGSYRIVQEFYNDRVKRGTKIAAEFSIRD